MYTTEKTISERLVSAKMALTNALAQEDIKEALSELGFTEARLNEGLALYQAADTLYQKQKREYTDQYLASEALQQAWDEAQIAFRKYATVAKLALIEQATFKNSIGLHSGRKFTLPEWITLTRVLRKAVSWLEPEICVNRVPLHFCFPLQLRFLFQHRD